MTPSTRRLPRPARTVAAAPGEPWRPGLARAAARGVVRALLAYAVVTGAAALGPLVAGGPALVLGPVPDACPAVAAAAPADDPADDPGCLTRP